METDLSTSPGSAQAWRWRVQIKVLRFLVSRYAYGELVVQRNYEEPASIPDFPLPQDPHPPKSLASMQRILSDVRQVNDLKPNDPRPSNVLPDGRLAPWRFEIPPPPDYEKSLLLRILFTKIRL